MNRVRLVRPSLRSRLAAAAALASLAPACSSSNGSATSSNAGSSRGGSTADVGSSSPSSGSSLSTSAGGVSQASSSVGSSSSNDVGGSSGSGTSGGSSESGASGPSHSSSSASGSAGSSSGGSTPGGPYKIMPLGDSITGTTCYPQLLSQEFITKGHTDFSFIGTNLNNQSCGGAPTVQTEGHGGYLVTYLTTNSPPQSGKGTLAELQTWAAEKPDVVLMHYGTNDVWNSIATATILSAYSFVVDQFRSQNPNVIFFVAQIIPLNPSGCTACETGVESLDSQIPGWATGKATDASPIHVIDVWSSLPAASYLPNSTYTTDGVHPDPAGAQLVADTWYSGTTASGIP